MVKFLKVMSVIMLVVSAIYMILGVSIFASSQDMVQFLAGQEPVAGADSATMLTAVKMVGVSLVIMALIIAVIGFLGFKGATGSKKLLMSAILMAGVFAAVSLFSVISGQAALQGIIGAIIPAAFVVAGLGAIKERKL